MPFPIFPFSLFDQKATIQPYIEDRERYERHINPTLSGPANKNRSDLFTRLRLGAEIKAGKIWSGKLEYQYAHDLFWTAPLNASIENSDLSLGYLRYSIPTLTLAGGRQKIELNEQRLIGPAEWLNLARSFDAARAQSGPWDLWWAKLGVANSKPETARMGALTHRDKDWGTTSLILKHDVASVHDIDLQTFNHFVSRKIGKGTTLSGEGALQYGSNNGRDQRAWAWHLKAAQELVPGTTLSLEADAASGGGNTTTSRTFDNLYPSNHNQYGLADMIGWKNMNHIGLRLENHPLSTVTLRAATHAYSLRDTKDAWYSASGTPNPRPGGTFSDPTGNSGRDIGKELDLEALYSPKGWGTLSAGLAFFGPGHYQQHLMGKANQMTYGFIQYQLRF